tara:strand:- start:854 stop:979 length:126 start_codon:yes stop_codon:yes gene_type:complete
MSVTVEKTAPATHCGQSWELVLVVEVFENLAECLWKYKDFE